MIIHAEKPIVEVHDLTVSYQSQPVLWSIDLTVPSGVLAGVLGPNGAGKSTLIKAILGLVEAQNGYARLFDRPFRQVRKRVSYVPQKESVDWDFPISVRQVVMQGRYGKLGLFRRPGPEDRRAVGEALEKTGIASLADRQISKLSGGQQQRVFLARSLAQEAELYFMDEPFAGVDVTTEKAIIELLKTMKQEGKTLIVVHHDLQTAADYFDWLVMLNTRLVASGPRDEVFNDELLQQTYGGKLTTLEKMGHQIRQQQFPQREKH